MTEIECQCCVVGGGSGGIGAALAAARLGVHTILIERDERLGGTSVNSGVNCWEPVAGATGIPYDIYRELAKIPDAVGIYSFGRHCCHPAHNEPPFPGGENVIDPEASYADTLLRSGTLGIVRDEEKVRRQWHGVIFEPEAFDQVVRKMLAETGHCRILSGKSLVRVQSDSPGKISQLELDDGTVIRPEIVVDGCGAVASLAGAELLRGEEPRSRFDEPGAPEIPIRRTNAVSLIFRCSPVAEARIEPLPDAIPAEPWWCERFPSICASHYPNGDLNCNMLPTMTGAEYLELGPEKAYAECVRRVRCHWHHLQQDFCEFRNYRLSHIFPRLGVRETFRVLCETMLTENDLRLGLAGQRHEDIITISDHMLDTHGAAGKTGGELRQPYGIPYRCLVPKGFTNLLVAGRIAGFSSLAASSCRLSRTMLQLGQAAGTATAVALESGCEVNSVDVTAVQTKLREQRVQLEVKKTLAF
jgi:hypothetical protein